MPKHVPQLPRDLFTDGDLHYQPQPEGYLLWRVGPSGIDNGGKDNFDRPENNEANESWDDLVLHVPATPSIK